MSVSPASGVITDNNGTMSAYEFTVTQSGKDITIITRNDVATSYSDVAVGYEND